ncbi:acyltransferase family protein [Simplicispira hankyongi]|uniref:Acyltransferase n=1 Tax=Simplicispira hankyongi TaxID=2315688 RepID=A0A398CAM4_9BURK|nr:acyltransferase family protein [Simplicispira hankyongi]RID98107.1 acyltransferase [Simplicispira hankyongi]
MSQSSLRSPWLDATKGAACLAIVAHHLSVYGPLSDTVRPFAPQLMAWLYDYARMAVQIFLVVGGYLAAASLAPAGVARFEAAGVQIARRFMRLAVPYAAALLTAVAAAALVRPWLDDPSVPDSPHFAQLLANALMLQDVLGQPALSAGVWYVAIDFQLYAGAVLLLALARRLSGGAAQWAAFAGKVLVVALCAASLLVFNRFAALDAWGIYFFGSYGLGMATLWAVRSSHPGRWLLALALLGGLALAVDFRLRILLALGTAAWLAWLALRAPSTRPSRAKALAAPLIWVGQRSYSVFLVHFPVCLMVNALFAYAWPGEPLVHAIGLLSAFGLSIAAGWLLYERVERHGATAWQALRWEAQLMGGSLLVALTHGHLAG